MRKRLGKVSRQKGNNPASQISQGARWGSAIAGGCGGGDPLPRRGARNVTPSFAQKLGANPSSSLPAPRKAPYFTDPSVQSLGCPNPDPPPHSFDRPPPPLLPRSRSARTFTGRSRSGEGGGGKAPPAFFCPANFLANFILSVALWRQARK